MPRQASELKDVAIRNLKPAPGQMRPVLYAVGGPRDNRAKGLYVQVTPNGAKSWVFRYTVPGTGGKGEPPQKRREMGLGSYPDKCSLLEARNRVADLHRQLAAGIDPIGAKAAVRRELADVQRNAITFRTAAEAWLDKMALEWKSEKDYPLNKNRFESYVFPKIGDLQMTDVTTTDIVEVMAQHVTPKKGKATPGPFWISMADTASKLRGYISNVFTFAAATPAIRFNGVDPTPSKKHVDTALGDPDRVNGEESHWPALPRARLGEFMRHLRSIDGTDARALEFSILCVSRAAPVYNATWAEFRDFERERRWIIPGEKMKGRKGRGREHHVPLSDAAIALLKKLPRGADADHVFPIGRDDMTLLIKRMSNAAKAEGRSAYVDPKELDKDGNARTITQHGFRSTFSDWASEDTHCDPETREVALAHKVSNAVEAAYRRGDKYQKRIALMNDWARFCGKVAK